MDQKGLVDKRFDATCRWLASSCQTRAALVCPTTPIDDLDGVIVRLPACVTSIPHYRVIDLTNSSPAGISVVYGTCCESFETLAELATLLGSDRLVINEPPEPAPRIVVDVTDPPRRRRGLMGLPTPLITARHTAHSESSRLAESMRAAGMDQGVGTPPARILRVTDCIACGVCVRACPTDALTLTEEDPALLAHQLDACEGELECARACPVKAITVFEAPTWAQWLATEPRPLVLVTTQECRRCHATMPESDSPYCGPCAKRLENPFGFNVPPDILRRIGRRPDGRPL